MNEFNLSEKIWNHECESAGDVYVLEVDYVREFIKRLKDEVSKWEPIYDEEMSSLDVGDIIDKLAGDTLNGNKTSEVKNESN